MSVKTKFARGFAPRGKSVFLIAPEAMGLQKFTKLYTRIAYYCVSIRSLSRLNKLIDLLKYSMNILIKSILEPIEIDRDTMPDLQR